ncbi:MAG TPA: NAD(P)/FAD-dependent oxidoreductase [Vicinamibacterales bacterium]|nr:NAD(P)/FAD-dependent oxidoreductase [Vicinamibacterales bacterium]
MTDVIVIGGGLNGLVAAATLAKAKLSVILLDERPAVGGACSTRELAPGFRIPELSHALGPISRDVVKALRLDRAAGLEFITPDPSLSSIGDDGRAISFHRDAVLTAGSINRHSTADAGRWSDFVRTSQRIAGVIGQLDRLSPPPVDDAGLREVWRLMDAGRAARKLSRRDLARMARWLPMSIADVVSEWFESDLLRAAIAAHAITGHPAGPRSAGTGAMWLQRVAADPVPVGSGVTARGGPGAVADAIAKIATAFGAEIRSNARVAHIATTNGRAAGVTLANGDEVKARAVIAAVNPKAALLGLANPGELPPTFAARIRNLRSRGVTAKINVALSAAPVFTALAGDAVPLGGRLLIAPGLDYLERAFDATKYGEMSAEPWLELSIPSVRDDSLAPAGAHVCSIYAHFAPRNLRHSSWDGARDTLWSRVAQVLESRAPGFMRLVVAREVMSPADLESGLGNPGGGIFHAECTIDQMWAARPLLGWSQYRTPIEGMYLASAGAHPGGGLTGLPGLLASRTVWEDSKKRRV